MNNIFLYQDLTKPQKEEVQNVFFQTALKKTFKLNEEKELYLYQYLGYYIENFPQYFLCFVEKGQIAGYICGENNTNDSKLHSHIDYLETFADLYVSFPVSLHINCSPHFQGLGIGSKLIEAFENLHLAEAGLHLLTAPGARNRGFYIKNGYKVENVRKFKDNYILFMGKPIKTSI